MYLGSRTLRTLALLFALVTVFGARDLLSDDPTAEAPELIAKDAIVLVCAAVLSGTYNGRQRRRPTRRCRSY